MHLKIQTETKYHKRESEKRRSGSRMRTTVECRRISTLYSRRKIKQRGGSARVADRITALYRVHLNSGRVTSNIKKKPKLNLAHSMHRVARVPAVLFHNFVPVEPPLFTLSLSLSLFLSFSRFFTPDGREWWIYGGRLRAE